MKARSEWTFKTSLDRVDFERIIKEANESHPDGFSPCIRVTIDGKKYTLLATQYALSGFVGFVTKLSATCSGNGSLENPDALVYPFRSDLGRVKVPCRKFPDQETINTHVIYVGDIVDEVLDKVTTTVEVF